MKKLEIILWGVVMSGLMLCSPGMGWTLKTGTPIPQSNASVLDGFLKTLGEKLNEAREHHTKTVTGMDGWLFFAPELDHIKKGKFWGDQALAVSRSSKPQNADPLPAILHFHSRLKEKGIRLILLPVPPKAFVYPDKIDGRIRVDEDETVPQLNRVHQQFYQLLRKEGVEVLDLTPIFLKARGTEENRVYCQQDTHWSGRGCIEAAKILARMIKKMDWYQHVPRKTFEIETREVPITGDLLKGLKINRPEKETLDLRFVGTRSDGTLKPIEPDERSPVLVLGDSHTLIFHSGGEMLAKGAGFPDQLSYELGMPVDVIGVMGSGARAARISLYRRGRNNPEYMRAKRVIIYCFTTRDFTETEGGWGIIPLPDG